MTLGTTDRSTPVASSGVFDAHAHLAPGQGALRRLLDTMDANGIDRAVVVAGGAITPHELSRQIVEGGHVEGDADNDAVEKGCEDSGGRLVPFFFANPHNGSSQYRERAARFSGLKLAPGVHGVPLLDPRTKNLVSVAGQVGHNVYLHCLQREGFTVRDLVALAAEFPLVRLVLGHAGVGDLDFYGVDLIADSANIHFETSGGYTSVIRHALDRLGPERVLFGSEHPLQSSRVELLKFEELGLTEEERKLVMWDNAVRLLGETP